jgi:hypothetical protein
MRPSHLLFATIIFAALSCTNKIYPSNGETIYKTGKNLAGEKMLDKKNSRIKIVNSCKTCHGNAGSAMKNLSLSYAFLSSASNFTQPYNDSLIMRFLDEDFKSDGSKANIGVRWKMSDKDKEDLIRYLKEL